MAAIVRCSELVWDWPGFGCKLEGCIHGAKGMIVARQGGLEHSRVLGDGGQEGGLVWLGQIAVKSNVVDNVFDRDIHQGGYVWRVWVGGGEQVSGRGGVNTESLAVLLQMNRIIGLIFDSERSFL